jgi:tRNA(Ile)-lysidine synthase|tara:strand:- start:1042 stop:2061 length:1020 start_codon:yes stop_codon:yes gene_type:complete
MSKKSISVLNLKNNFKNNKKISEKFLIFKNSLKTLKKNNFIVAVSGGPDSLALAAFSKALQYEKKIKVFYVLIDHGIRKDSSKEAFKVKRLLKDYKIPLNILTNKKKITKNIQKNAREVRYQLLTKFSKKKNIKYILTAHHSDDQIETFLIRLSRGSGVQGLSSMKKISNLEGNIKIFRPLLDFKKKDLIYLSKNIFGKVFKDPSNLNKKYLRTRVRKLKQMLEKNGIHHDRILQSIKNLRSTTETINLYLKKIYQNNVKKKKKEIVIDLKNISKETTEIQLKVISQAIKIFNKSYYPPRSKKIMNLITSLAKNNQKKFTLSGCVIIKSNNFLSIKKEA